MKTAGRITASLAAILSLYLLSYWILIKKDWGHKLLTDPTAFHDPGLTYFTAKRAFRPIIELEEIWQLDIPTRKHLIGSWRSETNSDFVTLGPNGECHFQMGHYTFDGTAGYDRNYLGFIMEFPYNDRVHTLLLGDMRMALLFGSHDSASGNAEEAFALVGQSSPDSFHLISLYKTTLTKQSPSPPTP